MNKKVCFFCVGTGGHVLPVRNLIKELKELGINNEDEIMIRSYRPPENIISSYYDTKADILFCALIQ